MATTVDNLSVKWGADFRELLAEYKKGEAASAQFRQKISREMEGAKKVFDTFAAGLKGLLIGAISALSIGKISSIARETLKWADDTATLAERLGVSTDRLQELIFAGREMNVTADQMAKGLQSFWAKVSEAATGKGEGVEVLKQLGLDPKSLQNAEQALTAIAGKLKGFDKQSQLTVAKTFFGDEKASQFLGLMLGDLEAAKAKARELGVVVDANLISKGEQLNKEFERVADVGIAKMRGAMLGVIVDVQTLVTSVGRLGPEFDKLADGLSKSFLFLPGLQQLRRDQDAARAAAAADSARRIGLGHRAAEDASMAKLGTGGPKRLNLDSGAASAMEQFEKQIQKVRIEAMALRHELDFGKAAAENAKALESFADAGGKFKPTAAMVREYSKALKDVEAQKTALAFKGIADENERLGQIVAAEVSGNRELVAILEQRFALEDKLGRKLTEAELARAEALAKTRFEMEQTRERAKAALQELESLVEGFASSALSEMDAFFSRQKTAWEALRDFARKALNDIANELLKLGVLNPILNALLGGNRPGLGDLGGIIGSLLGNSSSGSGILSAAGDILGSAGFAEGGRPPVGVPSIVGERGPELFVPDVAGTIVPNHKMGGSVTYIDARGADQVALARLEAIVRAQGSELRRYQAGEPARMRGHMADVAREGGAVTNLYR